MIEGENEINPPGFVRQKLRTANIRDRRNAISEHDQILLYTSTIRGFDSFRMCVELSLKHVLGIFSLLLVRFFYALLFICKYGNAPSYADRTERYNLV